MEGIFMINVEISPYEMGRIWDDLDWSAFSALWPLAMDDKPANSYLINSGPCRLSNEEALKLAALGIPLVVKPLPGMMVVKMQDRAAWDHDIQPQAIQDASAVQISVPDLGLLLLDEVCVREDYCTHALQGDLDDGWRILAICPPNAARRPDYILGRRSVR